MRTHKEHYQDPGNVPANPDLGDAEELSAKMGLRSQAERTDQQAELKSDGSPSLHRQGTAESAPDSALQMQNISPERLKQAAAAIKVAL